VAKVRHLRLRKFVRKRKVAEKKKGAAIENERLSSDEWSDIAGGLSEAADR
jgi:hypothetical protein